MIKMLIPEGERATEIVRILKPLAVYAAAAPDRREWRLRYGALRLTRRRLIAKYNTDEPSLWRFWAKGWFDMELRYLRKRQREIEKHFAKLQAKGIARRDWHLYPFKDANQRKRERERSVYIRHCQRIGRPIRWEKCPRH